MALGEIRLVLKRTAIFPKEIIEASRNAAIRPQITFFHTSDKAITNFACEIGDEKRLSERCSSC